MGTLQAPVVAAMHKNPGNIDECGPGNHVEHIYFPEVPKEEISVPKRLATMARLAGENKERLFEVKAALHNYKARTIDHGAQISRDLTPEERAAGHHVDSQKILAVCKKCGYRREIDHASDNKTTVEAKYKGSAIKSEDQRTNNAAFASIPGRSVTYKAPSLGEHSVQALNKIGLKFIPVG